MTESTAPKQYRPRLSERDAELILQSLGHRVKFYERIAKNEAAKKLKKTGEVVSSVPTAPAYQEIVALYDSLLNKAPGGASQRRYNRPDYVADSAHAD